MNPDRQIEDDLDQLARFIAPASPSQSSALVEAVMRRIEQTPHLPARPRTIPSVPLQYRVALAASVLLLLAGSIFLARRLWAPPESVALKVHSETAPAASQSSSPQRVREMSWQSVSQRVISIDDIPVREISRQKIERVEWYDPQRHATLTVIAPDNPVILTTMERY